MILKQKFINIDIFRIYLSVLVISIHSIVISNNVEFYVMHGIARWAVPMFFMLIGMHLSIEKISDKNFIKKYSRSQASIVLPWICFFIVISLFDILNSNTVSHILMFFAPFWFVLATCFSLLYLNILNKFLRFRYIFLIAIIFHLFGIFGDSYYNLIVDLPVIGDFYTIFLSIFVTSRWGFSFGLFYICLGIILTNKDLFNFKPIYNFFLLIICILIQFLEISFLRTTNAYDYNMYFSLIPISILLFNFIKRHSYSMKKKIDYKRISVYIFCTHTFFIYLVTKIQDIQNIRSSFIEVLIIYLFIAPLFILTINIKKRFKPHSLILKYYDFIKLNKIKILAIIGVILITYSLVFFDRGTTGLKFGLLGGLILLCLSLSLNITEIHKKSIRFILLISSCVVLLISSDYYMLKNYKLQPIYSTDIYQTEHTIFYSTMFYDAYILKNKDFPVHFESKREFNVEYFDYIENFHKMYE